ncbi:hypothetical protein [Cohnella rhizosphaerae]|uniref:Uncharacterized protein n=1 Tax=Cohnella rhizosphaerae TaxID=1457232 RepID=A0A9X4KY92_9BACL|nr:hypothetical protein [Cohnella rhizosphaerae]MDG0810534.1 hypothetical protein [Cohnella rhizosphaerae]
MSRSFKKTPVCNDHATPYTHLAKRMASKAVRRYNGEIANGKWYRKVYCSWNICDYRFYRTKQQAILEWETERWVWRRAKSLEAWINHWEKFYRRK